MECAAESRASYPLDVTDGKCHPACKLLPALSDETYDALKSDIEKRGLLSPIKTLDGLIVDGHHRHRACLELKIEPRFESLPPDTDPYRYVYSRSLRRDFPNQNVRYAVMDEVLAGSVAFQAELQRIKDEANKARAEATRQQPRSEDGTRLAERSGSGRNETTTWTEPADDQTTVKQPSSKQKKHKSRKAKAEATGVCEATVAAMDALKAAAPDLYEVVKKNKLTLKKAQAKVRKRKQQEKESEALKSALIGQYHLTSDQQVINCDALITDPPYGILDLPWEPGNGGIEDVTRLWATRWSQSRADFIISFFSQRYLWSGRLWFDESLTGYDFQQLLIWHYPNNKSPQSRQGFKQTWEPIFLYRRRGCKKEIGVNGSAWGKDLHDFDCHVAAVPQTNFNDADTKQHPAQKPVSVMRWLVNAVSEPGGLIVDPFMGSGTTGIAALQLNRQFHGIETDKDYLELAERRIASYGRI